MNFKKPILSNLNFDELYSSFRNLRLLLDTNIFLDDVNKEIISQFLIEEKKRNIKPNDINSLVFTIIDCNRKKRINNNNYNLIINTFFSPILKNINDNKSLIYSFFDTPITLSASSSVLNSLSQSNENIDIIYYSNLLHYLKLNNISPKEILNNDTYNHFFNKVNSIKEKNLLMSLTKNNFSNNLINNVVIKHKKIIKL